MITRTKLRSSAVPLPRKANNLFCIELFQPLSEEKKGVVYAELALGEQPAAKPPPPSTEYAEIVYTEQPPKENKE